MVSMVIIQDYGETSCQGTHLYPTWDIYPHGHGYIPISQTHHGGMGMKLGYRKLNPYPYPMVSIPMTHHEYVIPMHLPSHDTWRYTL